MLPIFRPSINVTRCRAKIDGDHLKRYRELVVASDNNKVASKRAQETIIQEIGESQSGVTAKSLSDNTAKKAEKLVSQEVSALVIIYY